MADKLTEIKFYIEIAFYTLLAISSLILFFKLIIKKKDKNKNGKIDTEEISDADIEFCKSLLKDSFIAIGKGIMQNSNATAKQTLNLMITEMKKQKNVVEEEIKKGEQTK